MATACVLGGGGRHRGALSFAEILPPQLRSSGTPRHGDPRFPQKPDRLWTSDVFPGRLLARKDINPELPPPLRPARDPRSRQR